MRGEGRRGGARHPPPRPFAPRVTRGPRLISLDPLSPAAPRPSPPGPVHTRAFPAYGNAGGHGRKDLLTPSGSFAGLWAGPTRAAETSVTPIQPRRLLPLLVSRKTTPRGVGVSPVVQLVFRPLFASAPISTQGRSRPTAQNTGRKRFAPSKRGAFAPPPTPCDPPLSAPR